MSDSSKPPPSERSSEDRQLAEELIERARGEGVDLVGPDGLLSGLTKNVLEAGLEAEMSEHLGYDRHDSAGKNTGNPGTGTRSKKVLTDVGPVVIEVPRDREGSFEPKLVIRLWENAWAEFVPFLDYSPEICKIIYSTNAAESLHARMRRATRARGHFPTEQAALKRLYMVVRSLDPTGTGRRRWTRRWKAALNAFAITFEGRILPTDN